MFQGFHPFRVFHMLQLLQPFGTNLSTAGGNAGQFMSLLRTNFVKQIHPPIKNTTNINTLKNNKVLLFVGSSCAKFENLMARPS